MILQLGDAGGSSRGGSTFPFDDASCTSLLQLIQSQVDTPLVHVLTYRVDYLGDVSCYSSPLLPLGQTNWLLLSLNKLPLNFSSCDCGGDVKQFLELPDCFDAHLLSVHLNRLAKLKNTTGYQNFNGHATLYNSIGPLVFHR
jgi:hypothetical protein